MKAIVLAAILALLAVVGTYEQTVDLEAQTDFEVVQVSRIARDLIGQGYVVRVNGVCVTLEDVEEMERF